MIPLQLRINVTAPALHLFCACSFSRPRLYEASQHHHDFRADVDGVASPCALALPVYTGTSTPPLHTPAQHFAPVPACRTCTPVTRILNSRAASSLPSAAHQGCAAQQRRANGECDDEFISGNKRNVKRKRVRQRYDAEQMLNWIARRLM